MWVADHGAAELEAGRAGTAGNQYGALHVAGKPVLTACSAHVDTVPSMCGVEATRPGLPVEAASGKLWHAAAQTDSWVQTKGLDPYYSLFDSRINALIAGAHSLALLLLPKHMTSLT